MANMSNNAHSFAVTLDDQDSIIHPYNDKYSAPNGLCLCGMPRNKSVSSTTTMLSSKRPESGKCQHSIMTVMLVFLLLTMVATGFLWYKFQELKRPPNSQDLCYPCEALTTGPSDEDLLKTDFFERKGDQCCVNSSEKTKTMVDLIFRRKFGEEYNKRLVHEEKVINREKPENVTSERIISAHLTRYHSDSSSADELIWRVESGMGHAEGVRYDATYRALTITESGFYHVYSQIFFSKSMTALEEPKIVQHSINRRNPTLPNNGVQELAHRMHKITPAESKTQLYYTSYTGLTVYLNIADKIYVNVSHMDLVSFDKNSNFFGLYKIR